MIMRDPYLYGNIDILINKQGIKDKDIMNEMEAEYTSTRLKQLIEEPIGGNYDFNHFCQIHKWIFQDIFDWAGVPRIINIEKAEPALGGISIEYADVNSIIAYSNKVLNEMASINWSELEINEKATTFSRLMAELWKVHVFREGNTRTVITFCCQFAEDKGFPLDRNLLQENSLYVRTSLVAASSIFSDLGDRSQPEHLVKIIRDSMNKVPDRNRSR